VTAAREIGVYLNGVGGDYALMREAWQLAEAVGFTHVWTMDNVVGPVPYRAEKPILDSWTVMPALAEATSTIRFGPMVSPFARRHPAVLAKSSSILDVISGGRLELGIGPGDEPRQHLPWGQAYPRPRDRIAILREEIAIIRSMWTEPTTTYWGDHYTLIEAVNEPKPLQRPHPPIWVGLTVHGKVVMPKVAAESADGVNLYVGSDELARQQMQRVADHARHIGRDPGRLRWSRMVNVVLTDDELDTETFLRIRSEQTDQTVEYLRDYYATYECVVAGTPEQVAAGITEHVYDLGIHQPIVMVGWLDTPAFGTDLDALATFGNHVLPLLEGRPT
jgi:alkanesulfonate monooxygenase SsuD/methylene tetrahydromethanopterin reductase-like flavin-dependent oxidoreductase (luciferase family)